LGRRSKKNRGCHQALYLHELLIGGEFIVDRVSRQRLLSAPAAGNIR
jgi:hypothetical protein